MRINYLSINLNRFGPKIIKISTKKVFCFFFENSCLNRFLPTCKDTNEHQNSPNALKKTKSSLILVFTTPYNRLKGITWLLNNHLKKLNFWIFFWAWRKNTFDGLLRIKKKLLEFSKVLLFVAHVAQDENFKHPSINFEDGLYKKICVQKVHFSEFFRAPKSITWPRKVRNISNKKK